MGFALQSAAGAAGDLATYRDAVQRAQALVVEGERQHDPKAGAAAAAVLAGVVGDSQPEIMADLRRVPPDLVDAGHRLTSLEEALGSPAGTSDPARAARELHRVLALPRYNPMRESPSLLNQILNWVLQRLADFLGSLAAGAGSDVLIRLVLLASAVAVIVIGVLVSRDLRIRRRERAMAAATSARAVAADRFAEADRLAATGDFVAALRALAGGVAAALGGEGAWEASPLTVRELFRRADPPERLGPLLLPFEAAVYGHRLPDGASYRRAAEAAAPYRQARP